MRAKSVVDVQKTFVRSGPEHRRPVPLQVSERARPRRRQCVQPVHHAKSLEQRGTERRLSSQGPLMQGCEVVACFQLKNFLQSLSQWPLGGVVACNYSSRLKLAKPIGQLDSRRQRHPSCQDSGVLSASFFLLCFALLGRHSMREGTRLPPATFPTPNNMRTKSVAVGTHLVQSFIHETTLSDAKQKFLISEDKQKRSHRENNSSCIQRPHWRRPLSPGVVNPQTWSLPRTTLMPPKRDLFPVQRTSWWRQSQSPPVCMDLLLRVTTLFPSSGGTAFGKILHCLEGQCPSIRYVGDVEIDLCGSLEKPWHSQETTSSSSTWRSQPQPLQMC